MKLLRKIIIIIYLEILLNSCTLITEPDPVYNLNASPPEITSFSINNLAPGQHVDGTIRIRFDSSGINWKDAIAIIKVDSLYLYNYLLIPFIVDLNTRNYSEGNHHISILIYQKKNQLGLLNIINAPNKIYETTLYFDRTPPISPVLSVENIDNKSIKLNWTESTNQNFYSYLIYKSFNGSSFVLIDSIAFKNHLSYVDTSGTMIVGGNYQYKVAVTTDYKLRFQSESNVGECFLGNSIVYKYTNFMSGPYSDENRSRFYFVVDNKLVCFSSIDNKLLKEINLSGLLTTNSNNISLTFNAENTRMYLYQSFGNKLWIFDAESLEIESEVTLDTIGEQIINIDLTRVLLNSMGNFRIIDFTNNQILQSIDYQNLFIAPVELNDDHTRLYTVGYINEKLCLETINLLDNNLDIINNVNINNFYFQIKKSGNKLICNAKWIYDSNTLNYLGTLDIGEVYNDNYSVTDNSIAILENIEYNIPFIGKVNCKKLAIYNDQLIKINEYYLDYGEALTIVGNKIIVGMVKNNSLHNIIGYSFNIGE